MTRHVVWSFKLSKKVLIEHDDSSPEESYDTDDNEENELITELEDLE